MPSTPPGTYDAWTMISQLWHKYNSWEEGCKSVANLNSVSYSSIVQCTRLTKFAKHMFMSAISPCASNSISLSCFEITICKSTPENSIKALSRTQPTAPMSYPTIQQTHGESNRVYDSTSTIISKKNNLRGQHIWMCRLPTHAMNIHETLRSCRQRPSASIFLQRSLHPKDPPPKHIKTCHSHEALVGSQGSLFIQKKDKVDPNPCRMGRIIANYSLTSKILADSWTISEKIPPNIHNQKTSN